MRKDILFLFREKKYNLYHHHLMGLNRNVRNSLNFIRVTFKRVQVEQNFSYVLCTHDCFNWAVLLLCNTLVPLGDKFSWPEMGKRRQLSPFSECFTVHFDPLEYKSFRTIIALCKSSNARYRKVQLRNLCGQG